jgi:hypothetical protein
LQFKKLEGEDRIYSARIGLEYRALALMKKDRIVWRAGLNFGELLKGRRAGSGV